MYRVRQKYWYDFSNECGIEMVQAKSIQFLTHFLSWNKATILKILRVQLFKVFNNDLKKDKNLVLKMVHLALLIFLSENALNGLKCN